MTRKTTIIVTVLAIGAGAILLVLLGIIIIVNPLDSFGSKVAIIEISGTIINSEPTIEQIHSYRDNPSVKSIVLRINSPGGAVVPTQEIYAELGRFKERSGKRIVASMGNTAASGGYYIACGADEIFANPGTLTGSIGVIMQIITAEGILEKIGVGSEVIKSGKFKDTGSAMRSMTDEERAILQETIDDVHTQFVNAVFEGRINTGLTQDEIAELSDGRIFSGQQAFERRLVDEIGGLQDAIKRAGELGGIKGEPRVIRRRRRKSLMETFLGASVEQKVEELFDSRISLRYEIY